MFVTLEVSNFVKSIDSNFLQLLNMYSIFSTLGVRNLSKFISILVNLKHESNKCPISLTLLVSKFLISNDNIFSQFLNIEFISSTLFVLNSDTSILSNFLQNANILLIFLTLSVLKLSLFICKEFIEEHPWNIYSILSVEVVLNVSKFKESKEKQL